MCATDRPWTTGCAGQPQPAPTTGCNDAASAQHHDPAASSIHGPNGSTNAREDSRGGSGAMYAAGADAGRWQCWGRMVAESCFKTAHCDGLGHPLRSALWIELEFARLWSRSRPGNPHSTKVGNRWPRAGRAKHCSSALLHEGRDPLVKGYPHCTNPRPPSSTPNPPPVDPDLRAVHRSRSSHPRRQQLPTRSTPHRLAAGRLTAPLL